MSGSAPPRGGGYGLIAGNGRFPLLVLEAARSRGIEMVVAAIKEEADPAIAERTAQVQWLGLGQLGKLIKYFHEAKVTRAVMAGQVKHKQIFTDIVPDFKMMTLLAGLAMRNTDSLIGAVAKVLEEEGIHLEGSTEFLQPLLAEPGTLTRRGPNDRERKDIEYGLKVARHLAAMDIGQSVAISDVACVAAEAMEGTDNMLLRAATLVSGRPLVLVKVAKPKQDLRFDVPVVGPKTIMTMRQSGATALAVEADKTLLLDREDLLAQANEADIAIEGVHGAH